jgi:hypothetical protein
MTNADVTGLSSQRRFDGTHKAFGVEWLLDESDRLQRSGVCSGSLGGRDQEHWNRCQASVGQSLLFGTKPPAVHHRHVQIEHYQIRTVLRQSRDPFTSILSLDDAIPVAYEYAGGQFSEIGIVVHNEYERGHATGRLVRSATLAFVSGLRPAFGEKHTRDLSADVVHQPGAEVLEGNAIDRTWGLTTNSNAHAGNQLRCEHSSGGAAPSRERPRRDVWVDCKVADK